MGFKRNDNKLNFTNVVDGFDVFKMICVQTVYFLYTSVSTNRYEIEVLDELFSFFISSI